MRARQDAENWEDLLKRLFYTPSYKNWAYVEDKYKCSGKDLEEEIYQLALLIYQGFQWIEERLKKIEGEKENDS